MLSKIHKEALKIPIKESNEPLLDIKKHCPLIFIKIWGIRAREKSFYARKSVIKNLNQAQKNLPKGFYLRVKDAYRPTEIQKNYYKKEYKRLKKRFPKWTDAQIKKVQDTLVYPPDQKNPPHTTGGALDITLTKSFKTGKSIPMEIKSLSKHLQNKTLNKDLPNYIKRNRKILYDAMQKAGFSNYPEEWWHWSFGDQLWALTCNKKYAIYGKVPQELLPRF